MPTKIRIVWYDFQVRTLQISDSTAALSNWSVSHSEKLQGSVVRRIGCGRRRGSGDGQESLVFTWRISHQIPNKCSNKYPTNVKPSISIHFLGISWNICWNIRHFVRWFLIAGSFNPPFTAGISQLAMVHQRAVHSFDTKYCSQTEALVNVIAVRDVSCVARSNFI